MIRTVLLPVDPSADCDLVLRFAAGLGALGVRRVVCGHVIDAAGADGRSTAAEAESVRETLRAKTRPLADAGLDVDVQVPTGDPEEELLALAAETHVDAVVCSTFGATAADRICAGAVAERLARDARVPSLTVRLDVLRNAADPAAVAADFGRKLLVPTDFSPTAARAVAVALELPPKAVGSTRVLHVVPVEPDEAKRAELDSRADSHLRSFVEMAREKGLPATPVLGHGEAQRSILAEIEKSRITGVIVGSRGSNDLQEAFMGSVSTTLMRQASCPVMIVP
jgi:nucleotide-binding universal stress UspA family protein